MTSHDVIKKLQDYTHLDWSEKVVSSGTGGTFLKARTGTSNAKTYYKLSCYDRYRGIYGHESVNELIASRLLDKLNIPHIPYRLIHARVNVNGTEYETWLSESKDYRQSGERSLALETYIDLNAQSNEPPLEICEKKGWLPMISAMLAFDYLIINRDRHGANIEIVMRDGDVELAPFFDHGLSFVCTCYGDEERIRQFDPLDDKAANNYLGTRSLETNLNFVSQGALKGCILSDGGKSLFRGLNEVISPCLREKIWEIIRMRWLHLIDLGIAKEDANS